MSTTPAAEEIPELVTILNLWIKEKGFNVSPLERTGSYWSSFKLEGSWPVFSVVLQNNKFVVGGWFTTLDPADPEFFGKLEFFLSGHA